jgi:hypothetical protein
LSPLQVLLLRLSMLHLLVWLENLEQEHVCKLRRTTDRYHLDHTRSRNSSLYSIAHKHRKLVELELKNGAAKTENINTFRIVVIVVILLVAIVRAPGIRNYSCVCFVTFYRFKRL